MNTSERSARKHQKPQRGRKGAPIVLMTLPYGARSWGSFSLSLGPLMLPCTSLHFRELLRRLRTLLMRSS